MNFYKAKPINEKIKYGGSLENRFRILAEIINAISQEFPTNRIGVRLSPNGSYNDMGSPDYKETFLYIAEQLNKLGLAYLHILDGLTLGFHNLGEPMTLADFRKVFKGPLIGNSSYTAQKAEAVIAQDNADLISFGRPFISNPDLVERYTNGWQLNPEPARDTWYSFDTKGYADYLPYRESVLKALIDAQ